MVSLQVNNVRLPNDGGRLKGFGYVEFATKEDLVTALSFTEEVGIFICLNDLFSASKLLHLSVFSKNTFCQFFCGIFYVSIRYVNPVNSIKRKTKFSISWHQNQENQTKTQNLIQGQSKAKIWEPKNGVRWFWRRVYMKRVLKLLSFFQMYPRHETR